MRLFEAAIITEVGMRKLKFAGAHNFVTIFAELSVHLQSHNCRWRSFRSRAWIPDFQATRAPYFAPTAPGRVSMSDEGDQGKGLEILLLEIFRESRLKSGFQA